VALPPGAVQSSGETGVIYVLHDSTVERRAVRLGAFERRTRRHTRRRDTGERVAVGDLSKLKDGAEIHIEP